MAIFLTHCFGTIDKRGSVRGYDNGVVKTVGGKFRVAPLTGDWVEKRVQSRAVVFQNVQDKSTITISSWCKRAMEEGSPENLSGPLFHGLGGLKMVDQAEIRIGGHPAYMMEVEGAFDAERVHLKSYVIKTHACVFDFLYVTVPGVTASVGDFDRMVAGFDYITGPDVL